MQEKKALIDGDLSLPLGLALGSPIFPSGCEGKLGVALESLHAIDKNPISGHLFEGNPVDEGTTRRGTDTRAVQPQS